jgi:hypothetical protein
MKYKLLIYCDVCNRHGKGMITLGGMIGVPDGWGMKQWPSGEQSIVCSKECAKEMDTTKSSIIVPDRRLIKQ